MDHHLKPAWYVHFQSPAIHPLASSDAPHCWLETRGADGPESADEARIRDIFRVGGGFYGWVGSRTTTRYLNGRNPALAVTQRRRRRREGRHHSPWRMADDANKESSNGGRQMTTATTTAAIRPINGTRRRQGSSGTEDGEGGTPRQHGGQWVTAAFGTING